MSMAGTFVAYLDTTVVNLAFPAIAESFPGTSRATLAWVLDGYLIVFAAFLVPAGRLADRAGRRRLFVAGLTTFALASLACAAAPSAGALIAARAVQALGGAILLPASTSLVLERFSGPARVRAVALWGATAGVAAAAGPTLGGLLVTGGHWRWIFVVNLPICLVALALARRVPPSRNPDAPAPDLLGGALVCLATGALTLGIVEGSRWGWADPRIVAAYAAALAAAAAAVARSRGHPAAVLDLDLLRRRPIATANAAALLMGAGFYALMLCNVLFLTTVWDYSIATAGLAITPGALLALLVALPAARLVTRHGHWPVACAGLVLISAGALWYVVRMEPAPGYLALFLPGNVLTGTGIGLAGPTLASAALATLSTERFGTGGSFHAASRQLGGALGVAVVVAIAGTPAPGRIESAFDGAWAFCGLATLAAAASVAAMSGQVRAWARGATNAS
jgi:EmrB/QacA subfamily drug resistance transporter